MILLILGDSHKHDSCLVGDCSNLSITSMIHSFVNHRYRFLDKSIRTELWYFYQSLIAPLPFPPLSLPHRSQSPHSSYSFSCCNDIFSIYLYACFLDCICEAKTFNLSYAHISGWELTVEIYNVIFFIYQ